MKADRRKHRSNNSKYLNRTSKELKVSQFGFSSHPIPANLNRTSKELKVGSDIGALSHCTNLNRTSKELKVDGKYYTYGKEQVSQSHL